LNEFVNAAGSASLEKANQTLKEESKYNDVYGNKERHDESSFVDGSIQVTIDWVTEVWVASFEIGRITQYKHVNEHTHDESNGDGDVREDGAEIAA
jgi:hypothetical protein